MHEFDLGTIAERVILTPAERGVLVEQAEAMKVNLDTFIANLKDGTPAEAIKGFIPVIQNHEYVNGIIQHKVMQVLRSDHEEGRDH